jgi:hypothetical protein
LSDSWFDFLLMDRIFSNGTGGQPPELPLPKGIMVIASVKRH